MKASRWPVDFEAIQKGDVITADRLEHITGVKRTDKRYALKVLAVKQHIEGELARMGRPMTLSCRKDDLVILTDAEATAYNHSHFRRELAGLRRTHFRMSHVDTSLLADDDQRVEHTRRLEVQSKYIQAIGETSKELRSIAHKRNTPGLLTVGQ